MRRDPFVARILTAAVAVALVSGCAGNTAAPPVRTQSFAAPGLASLASPAEIANAPLARLEDGTLKHDASSCSGSDARQAPQGAAGYDAGAKGTLLVSEQSSNPGVIEEFKADGSSNTPTGSMTNGLSGAEGIAVDKAGTLYVANNTASNVPEFPQGASQPGLVLSYEVLAPLAVGVDPSGNVYVVNDRGGPIIIFPPGQTMPSSELGGFYYPTDVAWDSSGNLYVVDHLHPAAPHEGAVIKFAPGKTKGVDLKLKGLWYPVGIAIDKFDDLIVSNLGNNSVTEYAPGTTTSKRTITSGVCDPVYMALNTITDLFVVEAGNNVVNMYKPISKTPSVTLSGKELRAIRGAAVNPNLTP